MERPYREAHDALLKDTRQTPQLQQVLKALEAVDNIDPLRVPCLRAMKRIPAPPLAVSYEWAADEGCLRMYVRNIQRKRKAPQPTICATVNLPAALFDSDEPLPAETSEEMRVRLADQVRSAFHYVEVRIGNYFQVHRDNQLQRTDGASTLTIEQAAA